MRFKLKDPQKFLIYIGYLGQTQRKFAANAGVSHSYLSQLINKKRSVSPVVAAKISKAANKQIKDIFLPDMVANE